MHIEPSDSVPPQVVAAMFTDLRELLRCQPVTIRQAVEAVEAIATTATWWAARLPTGYCYTSAFKDLADDLSALAACMSEDDPTVGDAV